MKEKSDFCELWHQHKQLKTMEMGETLSDTYDEGYIHQFQPEPCIRTKKVINIGKTSKTLSKVENISKNLQSILEISPVQKEVLHLHKLQETMHMTSRILLDQRMITPHRNCQNQ